jgi:hypothetical protein
MAKKATKRKHSKKQKLVRKIFRECSAKVRQGVGSKSVGKKARSYWTKRGLKSIRKQVNAGVDWDQAKKRVLPTATKMGKVAAALTGPTLNIIPLWAAKAASEAVKHDPKCPPVTGLGLGGFCP